MPAERLLGVALRALGQPQPGATTRVLEFDSPVDAVIAEAAAHDLVVPGVGEDWELEPHVFGLRSERLAAECPHSLLVVRGRAEATAPAS